MSKPNRQKPPLPVLNRKSSLARGLVLAIPFSEHGGNTFRDLAYRKFATGTGGPSSIVTPFGRGLLFDGSTQLLTVPKGGALDNLTTLSISFRVMMPTYAGSKGILSKGVGGWVVYSTASNRIGLFRNTSGGFVQNEAASALVNGVWVDLLVTHDGGIVGANVIKWYIDGVLQTASFAVSSGTAITASDSTLDLIVADGNPGDGIGKANINFADLKIWNRVLTGTEIETLYSDPYRLYRATKLQPGGKFATTLYPSGIASVEAFGTASIYRQGTLYPSGIASDEAFGTSAFGQNQTVTASGIASAEAFGTAALVDPTATQTITVTAGIASTEAFGTTFLIQGGRQTVLPMGIDSGEAFGFPRFVRGSAFEPISVKINGTVQPIRNGSLNITATLNSRGAATFDILWDLTSICAASPATMTVPVVGQYVEVYENQRKEFAGWLESLTRKVVPQSPLLHQWSCSCVDMISLLDRHVFTGTWTAGTSVAAIILDIVSSGLAGESVTRAHVSTSAVLTADLKKENATISELLNALRDLCGGQWWLDYNRDLHFAVAGDGDTAPYAFTSGDHFFQDMSINTDGSGFATSVIVRSDQNLG